MNHPDPGRPASIRFHAAWFALPVAVVLIALAVMVLLDTSTPRAAFAQQGLSTNIMVPLTLQSGDVIGGLQAPSDDNLEVERVAAF